MIVTFDSPDGRYDELFVSNYATLNVIDELRRIPGVGDMQVFGARDYSIRIWLQPDRLAELGLTPADVAAAVREQNTQSAAGRLGDEPMIERVDLTLSVTTQAPAVGSGAVRAHRAASVGDDGQIVRLQGRGARRARRARLHVRPHRARAGPVIGAAHPARARRECARRSRPPCTRRWTELGAKFPGRARRGRSRTTRASTCARRCARWRITFVEAMVLVFLVVWLFLYNLRATMIPTVAVPVSLIGTFAGMYLLGFSINSLTLFGMVLAIGIVVDDAIVVLENVERHMRDEHVGPARSHAARDGRGQPARHRDRARAERGVPAGRVPRRARRRDVSAVRDHDRGVGHDLGLRRAHADAGDVRAAAADRAKSSRAGCSRGSTRGFWRFTDALHRRRALDDAARRASPPASSC